VQVLHMAWLRFFKRPVTAILYWAQVREISNLHISLSFTMESTKRSRGGGYWERLQRRYHL